MAEADPAPGIAIIGLAGRFPGAEDVAALWRNLAGGVESIARLDQDAPASRGPDGSHWVPAKGILPDAECFDAAFFGLSPRAAELIDPQHRLFLECAWQALEDAGAWQERGGERIGVFAGSSTVSSYYHAHLLADPATAATADPFQMMLSNQPSGIANLVSYRLNLTGPSLALHTACSTGLAAVATACTYLIDWQCDVAVAGAGSLSLPLRAGYRHVQGGILSPDGHCRAFSSDAAGTVPGNGVGAVVLRRLADALAAGDHIYAVIRGFAVTNDGADKVGFTAPGIAGQARAIADALAMADFPAATISYVEAHGTGTPLGDAIEVEALCRAFGLGSARHPGCLLGSIKSNIGHLDAAAGIAGLVKLALMLEHRVLPPSLHGTPPNPCLAGTPFAANDRLRAWDAPAQPLRAGVSSFGMGGANVHLVLEEAPIPPQRAGRADRPVLLPLSGHTAGAVTRLASHLADHLVGRPDLALADVAFTLQTARRPLTHRCVLVCRDREEALKRLREVAAASVPRTAQDQGAAEDGLVFMLPGQGAQVLGMAGRLYAHEPVYRAHLDDCLALLKREGLDLAPLLNGSDGGPALRLNDTAVAQPAVFAVEYALARLLDDWGIRPAAMIGHSVGEYAVACLAGVLPLEEALRVVVARGRLIQALPRGGMLAVALPASALEPRLEGSVAVAARNAPDSTVIAGPSAAVEACQRRLEQEGIACRPLATSHAFHSPMMDPALPAFRAVMAATKLYPPRTPYVSGVTGTWIRPDEVVDPDYYVRHLREPVRFADGIETLSRHRYRRLLEVGPGTALTRLARRYCVGEKRLKAFATMPVPQSDDRAALLTAVGGLWIDGHALDGRRLDASARRVPLPPYPFERTWHWVPGPDKTAAASMPTHGTIEPDAAAARPADMPDRLAAEIAGLFQQQLGHAHVTIDDDFHVLGGDSLLAVRIVAILNRRMGVDLKPHDLVEAPTPRALALRIAAPGAAAPGRDAQDRPFMLVTLRQGRPGRTPLFLPHAVGGTVNLYRDMAEALDPALPVHALQAQALDGTSAPDRSVDANAARCIEAIRRLQARGPYRLAGSSFGGMLAYEIAQQLAAMGEGVELLALIDTPAMEELPQALADGADIVSYVAALLGYPMAAADLRPLARDAQIACLIERCAEALPPGITVSDLDLHLRVFAANTDAMRAYRIAPYRQAGRILYFRARERTAQTPAHPERPWLARLGERLELIQVSGNHLTMLRSPHVEAIAARLNRPLTGEETSAD